MTAQEYFIDTPLYQVINFNKVDESWSFLSVLNTNGSLRAYCNHCQDASIFRRFKSPYDQWTVHVDSPTRPEDIESAINDFNRRLGDFGGRFAITDFACTVCASPLIFMSWSTDKYAMKIGQLPSYADLYKQIDKKYQKVLGEQFKEFNTAVGLAAHGVGIGSFVYLRRILENLEEEAHASSLSEADWDEDQYQRSRFEERLALLSSKLPHFLVQNRALYGIMSKGIHELTEEDCLAHFDMVRTAIEMILDEKIEKIEREEKRKKLSDQIGKVKGDLKKVE